VNAAPDAAARLQDALLRETVAWCAAKSPYYRTRFGGVADGFRGLEDLARLPVLTRADVVRHHAELQCDPSLPAALQHTTGTTGAFLQVHRGPAEQAFVWDFFAGQLAAHPLPEPRPLYLNLVNSYHGALTGMPSHAYVLSAGVHDRAQAQQARGLLERTYSRTASTWPARRCSRSRSSAAT
jgi:phenylacetate-coenzyme A ligase PaaK-like adenylate-forming protein